jgi:hypothetical protein
VPPTLSRRWTTPWKWAVPLLAALASNACIVFLSTSPTLISDATIVFVAKDGRGLLVPALRVTIVDVAGHWRMDGLTASDGSFRCGVRAGVARVRAEVVPPAGYALARSESWPRQLDVSSGDNIVVDIQLTAR